MLKLFGDKKITSVAVKDLHEDFTVYEPGTLIVAPRRAGKSTLLERFTRHGYYNTNMPAPLIIVGTRALGKIEPYRFVEERCILPSGCREYKHAYAEDTYFCIDEISLIWNLPAARDQIPWDRVLCATTSELNFDELQGRLFSEAERKTWPEYSWINHIVIELPGLIS